MSRVQFIDGQVTDLVCYWLCFFVTLQEGVSGPEHHVCNFCFKKGAKIPGWHQTYLPLFLLWSGCQGENQWVFQWAIVQSDAFETWTFQYIQSMLSCIRWHRQTTAYAELLAKRDFWQYSPFYAYFPTHIDISEFLRSLLCPILSTPDTGCWAPPIMTSQSYFTNVHDLECLNPIGFHVHTSRCWKICIEWRIWSEHLFA